MFAVSAAAGLSSIAYLLAERCLRVRWRESVLVMQAEASPYRATRWVREVGGRAPPVVRCAAWSGILLGSVAVPGVVYAMAPLHFDGIALSLLPGVASAAAVWCAGWLLLARAPAAVDVSKLAARISTTANALGLALALLHIVAARVGWSDRESLAYVVVACGLSVAALPQAILLRAAAGRHANTFGALVRDEVRSPVGSCASIRN